MAAKGMYVLCEIDGVLADGRHRARADIEDENTRLMAGDNLIFPTSRMIQGFQKSGADIVLVSFVRVDNFQGVITRKWLKDVGVDYDLAVLLGAKSMSPRASTLAKWLLDMESDNILMGVIGRSKELLDFAREHPHKPVIYEVSNC
ncbi:TPA: hypothetical protein ACHOZC_003391 [Raoultella ornithinolytica]